MIRFGILGTAKVADQLAGAVMAGARIESVASRSPERAKAFAERCGIPRVHRSYQALLDDPSIDAVYIPLPNHLHAPYAILAAKAGKHVLLEKPAVLSLAEARAVSAACRRHGVLWMEAFMYRFTRVHQRARSIACDGTIGRVRAIHFSWCVNRSLHGPGGFRMKKHEGGGALFDLGVYGLDFMRFITGSEPVILNAYSRARGKNGIDTMTHILLSAGDVLCTIDCGFDHDANFYMIAGEKGSVVAPGSLSGRQVETKLQMHFIGNDARSEQTFAAENAHAREFEYFADCIMRGTEPETGEANAVANARLIDQTRRRARRW